MKTSRLNVNFNKNFISKGLFKKKNLASKKCNFYILGTYWKVIFGLERPLLSMFSF